MTRVDRGRFDLRVLGPLEAIVDGRPVGLGGRRQQAVLGLLALEPNRVMSSERLIDELWGESPSPGARNTLQTYVARLRRVLATDPDGDRILTIAPGYRLRIDPDELDAARFESLLEDGRRAVDAGEPTAAASMFASAVSLWRGPVLSNLEETPAVESERSRLDELRVQAEEALAEARLDGGKAALAIPALDRLIAEHPLRERGWELLMLALYRSGRQADALASYHRIRRHLADELGLEPGAGLRRLEERILHHDPSLRRPGPAAAEVARRARDEESPASAGASRRALPIQLTSFIGRERELAELESYLQRSRLVTVTGVGGSGKTRLAVELAGRLADRLAAGAWLIGLEDTADGPSVARVLAETLGVREEPGRPLSATVADAIGEREMLLVLDNCEHLLEATSSLAGSLLTTCPRLRLLATSREPLAVRGEVVLGLPPLELPQDERSTLDELGRVESARLFLERAGAASPEFHLRAEDGPELVRLLRRLDGLPLALELAATRVRSLGIGQILGQLERGARDLAAVSRSAPERQRTLSATVAWSYRLLTGSERRLLDRLAVFAGSFDADAVSAVCAGDGLATDQVIDLLANLVDKSLVVRLAQTAVGTVNYRLLDTIRRFAADQLASAPEGAAVRVRHVQHFVALTVRAEPELRGPAQRAWLDRLDQLRPDLLAALDRCATERDAASALRLTAALHWYWEMRGQISEGLEWLQRAIAIDGPASPAVRATALTVAASLATAIGDHRAGGTFLDDACLALAAEPDRAITADVHHARGLLAQYQGQYRRAVANHRRALAFDRRLGRRWHTAHVLHHLGMVVAFRGDYDQAGRVQEESLGIFRELGDRDSAAAALRSMSVVAIDRGDLSTAKALSAEALAILEEVGDEMSAAHVRYTLGDVARLTGDMPHAEELYARSVAELRAGGDRRCVASTLCNQGVVALARGATDAAAGHLHESLALRLDLDDQAGVAECFEDLAAVSVERGDGTRAAQLFGAADALRTSIGSVRTPAEASVIAAAVARLRRRVGARTFGVAHDMGAAMDLASAAALALSIEGVTAPASPPAD